MGFNASAGSSTSYYYLQPSYQAGVVPAALHPATRTSSDPCRCASSRTSRWTLTHKSGMLIGLTETFPNGVRFGEFKEGGAGLTCRLAGVIADTDQAAGGSSSDS